MYHSRIDYDERMRIHDTWFGGRRVTIDIRDGRVHALGPPSPAEVDVTLSGGMVCPHFAEPHVHLDATQLGARRPNRSGTLFEGIDNWASLRASVDAEDVRRRALKTVRWYVQHGTTRIRTHVDTGSMIAARALIALRTFAHKPSP